MNLRTRVILILTFILCLAAGLTAQETKATKTAASTETTVTAAATTTAAPPAVEVKDSHEVRNELNQLLRQSPSELGTILALDPTLLSDDDYLARYPVLARYVAAHPEVRHNPNFYLSDYQFHERREGSFEKIFEDISVMVAFGIAAFALAWLIRTVIEQKRWNRLSRTQTEVHNKILDRFGNTEELMQYIRTPAGSKFLESAPIPLHSVPAPQNAPLTRATWSVQIGVIIAAAAVGMLIVSGRMDKESAEGFYALGVIGLCIGGGFVLSAIVSLFLSRRLGVWQAAAPASDRYEDAGNVA